MIDLVLEVHRALAPALVKYSIEALFPTDRDDYYQLEITFAVNRDKNINKEFPNVELVALDFEWTYNSDKHEIASCKDSSIIDADIRIVLESWDNFLELQERMYLLDEKVIYTMLKNKSLYKILNGITVYIREPLTLGEYLTLL